SIAANSINVAEWEQLFQSGNPKAARGDSPINKVTGNGSFTADTIVYDDLKLANVQSPITLDHGIITMSPLTARLYNGQQTGKVVVNARTKPVTYTVDSKLEGVDANQLLSAVSPVKQTLYGILSATADTHFVTAAGAHGILPSLNGRVGLN